MGRKTYEFGYEFGLQPGQPAYNHMQHYIFSETLNLDNLADSVHIEKVDLSRVKGIQKRATTDIYLCGGGQFAGWLLDNGMIDQLKLKVNTITLGDGIPLFGNSKANTAWKFAEAAAFDGGLQLVTYDRE